MQENLSDKMLYEVLGTELQDSEIINAKMREAYETIRAWNKGEDKGTNDQKAEVQVRTCQREKSEGTEDNRIKFHSVEKRNFSRNRSKKHIRRKICIAFGSMAAVLCLTFIFCVMNPVMAREIPVLGSIFAKVADVFPFGKLPEEESETLHEESDTLYQVTDGGITVTLEQEYVSNQALFIGIRVESEEAVPELVTLLDKGGQFLTLRTKENYSFRAEDPITTRRMIEGKFEDEHTFIGIIRISYAELSVDKRRYGQAVDEADKKGEEYPEYTEEWMDYYEIPASFDMNLEITQIIGTLKNPTRPEGMKSEEELNRMTEEEMTQYWNSLPKEWIGFPNQYQHWYQDGTWSFEVPVTQRSEAARVIEIYEDNGDGIGIESIELSPVELTLHTIEKTEEIMRVVIFDADGKEIEHAANAGDVYAIEGHDISILHIYICSCQDWEDQYVEYQKPGNTQSFQELIQGCAVFQTVVNTEEH